MIDPQQAGRLAYRSALRSLHSRITGSAGVACPMDRPLSKGTGALQREKKGSRTPQFATGFPSLGHPLPRDSSTFQPLPPLFILSFFVLSMAS